MIIREKSLLPIVNFSDSHGWGNVYELSQPWLDQRGLDRLKKTLDRCLKAVAIEREYIDKDYRNTFSSFHSKKFSTPRSRCIRLHFFDEELSEATLREATHVQDHYIGYSIVRPTRPNCIGRTLLNPKYLDYCCGELALCEEKVFIQGTGLRIEGFPFISQDVDATVCAQSSLWMLLRFFSNKYSLYREVYPYQINELLENFSMGRNSRAGLTDWQMAEAIRQLGFTPLIYSRKSHEEIFDHLLYTYIESGIPALTSVPHHVFVAYGHQSDYTISTTGKEDLIFSSHYNTSFIINDDNCVPYQVLATATHPATIKSKYSLADVEVFTVPLPEKVFLPAEEFQEVVLKLLNHPQHGYKTSLTLASERLVLRLFLTTGRSFKSQLQKRDMGNDLALNLYRSLPLPHFIWLCEISTVELFPQGKILGEVLWDATRNAHEPDGWIALHYPEKLIADTGSALNGDPVLRKFDLPNHSAYPVYRHNLKSIEPVIS